jgi:hypothetical protein
MLSKMAMNDFSDYLGRWERLPTIYSPIFERQRLYINETVGQIFQVGLPRILTDLDNAGFSLKGIPGAYGDLFQTLQREATTE